MFYVCQENTLLRPLARQWDPDGDKAPKRELIGLYIAGGFMQHIQIYVTAVHAALAAHDILYTLA